MKAEAVDRVRRHMRRVTVIRFLLTWSFPDLAESRGPNLGATGFDKSTAIHLTDLGLVEIYDYKPHTHGWRNYYRVKAGPQTIAIGSLIREELRLKNVGFQMSSRDRDGAYAFHCDWRTRRESIQAASLLAYERWLAKMDHKSEKEK